MDEKRYQSKHKRVGQAYDRKDAREKVTGQAIYTYDLELPGMLHARCLLSLTRAPRSFPLIPAKPKLCPVSEPFFAVRTLTF